MKKISLLGSTGSIGRNACDVVDCFPEDFCLVGMSAGGNLDLFESQVRKFRPKIVSMISESDALVLQVFATLLLVLKRTPPLWLL